MLIICLFCISLFFAFISIVLNENDINIIPPSPSPSQQRSTHLLVDENSNNNNNHNKSLQSPPIIDEARSNISSSIGPATSTPSPTSTRHYKPVSLTSTKTYFKTLQENSSSPILQAKRIVHHHHEDDDSLTILTPPRISGEKRDIIATVRFSNDRKDENGTTYEETYL